MKSRFLIILSTVLLTSVFKCVAADTIFMQISDIKGSATERNHEEWHALISVDWSVERLVDMDDLGGIQRGDGIARFSKIELTRQYDYSTPQFYISVANGTIRPEILLHFTRSGDSAAEGLQTYMTIRLKEAVIDSLSHSASEDGIPEETITIAYTAIEIITQKTDPRTGELGTGQTALWNIRSGKSEY